jgi:hypothetical protein
MKNGSNTRISNKFCFFPHDHEHNTEGCHALKKINTDFPRISLKVFFFLKKNPEHERKQDCIFDDLLEIK